MADSSPDALVSLLSRRGIRDARVLRAFREVSRAPFCPLGWEHLANEDEVVPIAEGVTLSQPFVVAAMLEALQLRGGERVLDVGSGTGFTTALLCRLASMVCAIESDAAVARAAEERLSVLGLRNFAIRSGDGWLGWPELAPFDAILISGSVPEPPPELLAQLAPGGRLVAPVGGYASQELEAWWRDPDRGPTLSRRLFPVRFVPLVSDERG
ncbi:MAG: protein-L-isoaspartate O-methyltransferase [Planctomycetota bacterium]|nr:protein-L-isoaspartate O-methyltransferase [Planctomycetota bacterium]